VLTECGGLVPLAAAEARRLVAYDGYITTYDPHPNGIAALAHGRQEP
jgi:hypothetical protein